MSPLIAPLALILALTGCDDTDIGRIERRTFLNAPELAADLGGEALLVEVHGLPWPGADTGEVVATLRMPEGPANAIRFQEVPAGQGHIGGGIRLVLRFNPPEIPDRESDCRATSPLAVDPPGTSGFSVNATFCKNQDWQIRTFAEINADSRDWLTYYQGMGKVLGIMFPSE